MAFQKDIMTEIGVLSSYHVVSGIHWYPQKNSAHIDVSSYVSKQTYEQGSVALITRQYEFIGDRYPFDGAGCTLSAAYAALKTVDLFTDAHDV